MEARVLASQPAGDKSIACRVEQGNGRLITELLTYSSSRVLRLHVRARNLSLSLSFYPFLPLEKNSCQCLRSCPEIMRPSRHRDSTSAAVSSRIPPLGSPPVVKIRFLNNGKEKEGWRFLFLGRGEKESFSPCLLSNGIFGRWKLIWRIDRLRVYYCIRLNFDFSGSRKYKRWRGEREIFRKGGRIEISIRTHRIEYLFLYFRIIHPIDFPTFR